MKNLFKIVGLLLIVLTSCLVKQDQKVMSTNKEDQIIKDKKTAEDVFVVTRDISLNEYFEFMDSVLIQLNEGKNYMIDEHILVQFNNWIIDSLVNTDYYLLKSQGIKCLNPLALIVLDSGQVLSIPDSMTTMRMKKLRELITIDVNIPEFKLSILKQNKILYSFPIRVGQSTMKYLAMSGRETDLRTHTGIGSIVRINKNPTFINPTNNHKYTTTRRDDGFRTTLPNVPWLEPEINGQRFGQLIHPTTNPVTLGKAYSNGCIGLKEGDMWRVYYFAPIGTKVHIRYDLNILNEDGDSIRLKHIYRNYSSFLADNKGTHILACHCELN